MKANYWFRARKQHIGWVPSTWQGWTVLAVYLVALVYAFLQTDGRAPFFDRLWQMTPNAFVLTLILVITTYLKGEPTSWRAAEKK